MAAKKLNISKTFKVEDGMSLKDIIAKVPSEATIDIGYRYFNEEAQAFFSWYELETDEEYAERIVKERATAKRIKEASARAKEEQEQKEGAELERLLKKYEAS